MRLVNRILTMCQPSWDALKGTLMVCCAMAFCSFVILIDIGEPTISTYCLYRIAQELSSAPAGLLLIAGIGTVLVEEQDLLSRH